MAKRQRHHAFPDESTGETPVRDTTSIQKTVTIDQSDKLDDINKTRTFLAALACEHCRAKKTRCDEDRPKCGPCRNLGIECVYGEKRFTKKDQSLSAAVNAIRRLEAKIEDLTTTFNADREERRAEAASAKLPPQSSPSTQYSGENRPQTQQAISTNSPIIQIPSPVAPLRTHPTPISFSQHATLQWPAVREVLFGHSEGVKSLGPDYVIELESTRLPLPAAIEPYPHDAGGDWLQRLPFSMVRGLSDLYFLTFNRTSPILDKDFYFQETLGVAVDSGFADGIECCLVLNVLALGCLALDAYDQGDFELPMRIFLQSNTMSQEDVRAFGRKYIPPDWHDVIHEDYSGLRFFNEGRKRSAFYFNENSLPSCQNIVLTALYYAQIVRPMDSWTLINRACVACIILLKRSRDLIGWEYDMLSRVFWSAVMNETILVQELDLPSSGLAQYEDDIPIPKFIKYPNPPDMAHARTYEDDDDSYFHYHFLAQVAHRIILTRIRNSIYFYSDTGDFPPPAIVAELQHQLEQWREKLPPVIQFSDDPSAERHASPAHAVANATLRSRYKIAKFHIGRPFFYKVLHRPETVSDRDIEACKDAFEAAMFWPAIQGTCKDMTSFAPLKFAFCCQFFGQFILYHVFFKTNRHPMLRSINPPDWDTWRTEMIGLFQYCAALSPAVAKDLELISELR